jgi:predicted transcriptional regulator
MPLLRSPVRSSMKSHTNDLTRRERQLMDACYAAGEASASEIQSAVPDPPGNSAVRTFLRILVEKGHLRLRRDGIRYLYSPVEPRKNAARSMLKNVVQTFFRGSIEEAATTLLSGSDVKLSPDEAARLSALIEKAKQTEGGQP